MKLSANSLGIFIFTAIASVAFSWMAKRPLIEKNQIMQFGMPLQAIKKNDKPELINEKPIKDSSFVEKPASNESNSPSVGNKALENEEFTPSKSK